MTRAVIISISQYFVLVVADDSEIVTNLMFSALYSDS